MKAGTIIRLPDGREGTVVYNSLCGVGIKWGRHRLTADDLDAIMNGDGNTVKSGAPVGYLWNPDALLRNPWPGADMPCVGEDYEVVS